MSRLYDALSECRRRDRARYGRTIAGLLTIAVIETGGFLAPQASRATELTSGIGRGTGAGPALGRVTRRRPRQHPGRLGASSAAETAAPLVGVDFAQHAFRAHDGTVYQVLRAVPVAVPTDAEAYLITQIAGGVNGLTLCSVTSRSGVASTVGASALVPQILYSGDDIRRTTRIIPSDVTTVGFDANGSGTLTLGSGSSALRVCGDAAACEGFASAPLVPISFTGDGVPAACTASAVSSACTTSLEATMTIAFGLPADATHDCQAPPTTSVMLCDTPPNDGLLLRVGEAIVFVYGSDGNLQTQGFAVAAATLAVDSDNHNYAGCSAGEVVSAGTHVTEFPSPPTNAIGVAQ
jgi:hypothetical protein